MYAIQITAIIVGYKLPNMAVDVRNAEQSFAALVPAGVGLLFGTAVRVALNGLGWFRRQAGSPVRFFPKTTRELLLVVACFAVATACIHRLFAPATIYATGYTEARFEQIRSGMTGEQVESKIGPPLSKSWDYDGELWSYSEPYIPSADYHPRGIILKNTRVESIISD
jgi:hypothetical protein